MNVVKGSSNAICKKEIVILCYRNFIIKLDGESTTSFVQLSTINSRENGNRKGDRRQHSESCNGEIEGDEYGGNRKGDCQQNDAVRIQFI